MEGLGIEIKSKFEIQCNQFEALIIGYIGYIQEKKSRGRPEVTTKGRLERPIAKERQGKALLNKPYNEIS